VTARKQTITEADRALADRVHSAAIRLLRRLRTEDDASGLSAPRASALSVLVFVGPQTLGDLARAEQVKPPTVTRLVQDMHRAGLVRVVNDKVDKRIKRVSATAKGKRFLVEGKERRVTRLARALAELPLTDRRALEVAARVLFDLAPKL
jgi:DNA-binding MarR family transcriptional regulator